MSSYMVLQYIVNFGVKFFLSLMIALFVLSAGTMIKFLLFFKCHNVVSSSIAMFLFGVLDLCMIMATSFLMHS